MIRADALQVRAGGRFRARARRSGRWPTASTSPCVGPSGAGKSVLLEALAGLRPAAAGRIAAGERDVTGAPPERRGIGLVGQRPLLFPHLTVARNIAFGPAVASGGLARWSGAERRRRPKLRRRRPGCPRRARWPRRSASSPCSGVGPARCRAASASASRWPARSPLVPARCCSTSRSAPSIRRPARSSRPSWSGCTSASP